jgi:hypothetical protein
MRLGFEDGKLLAAFSLVNGHAEIMRVCAWGAVVALTEQGQLRCSGFPRSGRFTFVQRPSMLFFHLDSTVPNTFHVPNGTMASGSEPSPRAPVSIATTALSC